jgi:hypothetical protein
MTLLASPCMQVQQRTERGRYLDDASMRESSSYLRRTGGLRRGGDLTLWTFLGTGVHRPGHRDALRGTSGIPLGDLDSRT